MNGQFIKVYIDDVVVKPTVVPDHLGHLMMAFDQIRKHKLNKNHLKLVFRAQANNFLGLLVH